MDLFVINRYEGEHKDVEQHDDDDTLKRVLKKIKKRKSKLEQNINQNSEKQLDENISTTNGQIEEVDTKISQSKNEDLTEEKIQYKEPTTKDIEGFTVLGAKFDKKKKVKRVLPRWLINPHIISMKHSNTEDIIKSEIDNDIKEKLKLKNIRYLFPVQAEFIPWQHKTSVHSKLIKSPDVCISAPTGSGKTLAFAIPLLQYLKQKLQSKCQTIHAIRALVILPTHELALQIYNTFQTYIDKSGLNVAILTGSGQRLFQDEQKQLIISNSVWGTWSRADILICTAGRLVDHLKLTKGFNLRHLEYIIIDEADRVLDAVQDDWLYHLGEHMRTNDMKNRNIINLLSMKTRKDPQKLLFSATLSQDPEKLEKLTLFQPKLFTSVADEYTAEESAEAQFIGKYTKPEGLSEKYILCEDQMKPLVFYKLIQNLIVSNSNEAVQTPRFLVFTNSAETSHRLAILFGYLSVDNENKVLVADVSSKRLNVNERKERLELFEKGQVHVLISTDLMARGIDVAGVNYVISYDMPIRLKTHIHRSGRTARAGTEGTCITMLQPQQQQKFLSMTKHGGNSLCENIEIDNNQLEALMSQYENALAQFKQHVTTDTEKSLRTVMKRKKIFAAATIGNKRFKHNRNNRRQ